MSLNNNTTTASYVSTTEVATNNNLSTITFPQGYISSSLSSSGSITNGSILYSSSSSSMIEIEVLGKKFKVYPDTLQQICLAQIDFLGIGYWESLKKMSLSPISNKEIKEFLDKKLKSWQRKQKIEKIISQA